MSPVRILIVDDHEAVRRGLLFLLSSHADWEVCGEAQDGLEAVEKAKALRPDIVLMDISMPRMNGLDATRIIRSEIPESKVVIVSQNDSSVTRRQTQEVDAAACVIKTELFRDLLPTIEGMFGDRNPSITSNITGAALSRIGAGSTENALESTELDQGRDAKEPAAAHNGDGVETTLPNDAVPLEAILCTEELHRRSSRPPDHQKENEALAALAQALAESPGTVFQTLADTILDVLHTGSAGISLLTTHDHGKRFYWPAIAGQWKAHIGGGTPRNFGPCGDVLDRNTPLLFKHIERRYTYFQPVTPPVEECLLVPFYVQGKAVGTIWAIAHDERRKFDAEDERLMISLGKFASSAYQVRASIDVLRAEAEDRQKTERASVLLAAIVDSSDDAIVSKNLDGIISSWNRGAERVFGYTAEEAVGQHITLIVPRDRRDEEATIIEKLKRGERVDHFETVRVNKRGESLDVSLTISPLRNGRGDIVGASKVARDITEKKRAERALRRSEERLRSLTDDLEAQVQSRTQELEQRNAEIVQQTDQLRELSNRLLQSQDEERRRIARELHDSAGQILTALGLTLASITTQSRHDSRLCSEVGESQNLVQQLSKEIRTVSYLLHPPLLDDSGLTEALHWYIEGLAERSGMSIELSIPEDFGRLSNGMELLIFRVVQECLTNVHRHSGSKDAQIRLAREADSVYLEVQDYGKGISAERLREIQARGSGVGFRGMRERVRQYNGEMKIESGGVGTRICITLPTPKTVAGK